VSNPNGFPRRIQPNMQAAYTWEYGGSGRDVTENGKTGTLQGNASTSEGVLTLGGTGDYVSANSQTPATTLTVTAWIKTASVTTSQWVAGEYYGATVDRSFGLLFAASSSPEPFRILISADGSNVNSNFYNTSGASWWNGSGVWHHTCMVIDLTEPVKTAAQMKFYMDGVFISPDSSLLLANITTLHTSGGTFNIGSGAGAGGEFNGDMGETRVYNRALTAAEVQTIFNDTRGDYI